MTIDILNRSPYVRTTREFPSDPDLLRLEINRSYIDLANGINNRTIADHTTGRAAQTGENWYLFNNKKQQGFRQVYTFTASGNIAHGLSVSSFYGFVKIYGMFTDGTNWYPLPHVDVTNVANQVSVSVTSTNIVITRGASAPSITSGTVVLEFLSNP